MSARGLTARSAITLLALAPGIALSCSHGDAALPLRLGLAALLALAFEAIALRLRAQPLRPFLVEGSAIPIALLIVLWLPTLGGWQLASAVFVAIVVARQAFGGLGAQVFNPVMAAIAFAQLAYGSRPGATIGPDAMAVAWALGGIALCVLRIARWQLPLGLLVGAAITTAAMGRDPLAIASAPWLLAAFFIAPDSASGCEQPRARLPFAFATGVLAAACAQGAGVAALPCALLAMNAVAPALDRWLQPRRHGAVSP